MAISDKQFVAMVFNPALEFGETIPKIEGRPWDEDIGRLRNYVMRRMPQATIAYLWERVEAQAKRIEELEYFMKWLATVQNGPFYVDGQEYQVTFTKTSGEPK